VRDDQYGYDASANVASVADLLPSNVSSRSMTYDGLDRLKTTAAPNLWGTATYGYDALDHLISTTITGGISARNTLHNINATTNRLDSISNGPAGFNVSYGYDVRGNVTQRNSQVFEYDSGERMKRAVGRATYTYDGFKRRVSVVGTDGVTRVQVYAQDGKLLYTAASGGTATKYIYLRNHVLAEVNGATVTYSHTDALGSPVAQTNAAGAVLNRTRYEPYGYIVAGTPRTIGFTGHVNDNDTGLVYMQQRYYDAVAGRFLGVDPVVTDANSGNSFNRYAYAVNNPYTYIDPDGRSTNTTPASSRPDNCQSLGCINQSTGEATPIVHHTGNFVQDMVMDEYSNTASTVWNAGRAVWNGIKEATILGIGGAAEGGAVAASDKLVTIYRAVGPAELASISKTNALSSVAGLEGKYFTTSAEAAASYARQAVKAFGDPAYTIVSTRVPQSVLNLPGITATVDRGIPAYVIPNKNLQGLAPKILNYSPVP